VRASLAIDRHLSMSPVFKSVTFVKSVHSVIFFFLTGWLFILLYEVVCDRLTVLSGVAIAIFVAEGILLVARGWRCPLTVYAEKLGAASGQVTDIFLPKWLADRIFVIYGYLFGIGVIGVLIRLWSE
jgi:hypothetical protein